MTKLLLLPISSLDLTIAVVVPLAAEHLLISSRSFIPVAGSPTQYHAAQGDSFLSLFYSFHMLNKSCIKCELLYIGLLQCTHPDLLYYIYSR